MFTRLAYCLVLFCFVVPTPARAGDLAALDVHALPAGGVKATATIFFPAKPAVLQRLLSDYLHWPELFEVPMRIAELREQDGVAFTDIRIDHALVIGERRLLCESRALPGGGLLTELKGGDFRQYRRVWKLSPAEGGSQTRADFELLVEIESIVPDALIAVAMRQELETHFRIVREKVLARATKEKKTPKPLPSPGPVSREP
jgi:hypothetical protein